MLFVGSLTAENSSGYFDRAVAAVAIFYVVMAIEMVALSRTINRRQCAKFEEEDGPSLGNWCWIDHSNYSVASYTRSFYSYGVLS